MLNILISSELLMHAYVCKMNILTKKVSNPQCGKISKYCHLVRLSYVVQGIYIIKFKDMIKYKVNYTPANQKIIIDDLQLSNYGFMNTNVKLV